jgi:hypothetical protein
MSQKAEYHNLDRPDDGLFRELAPGLTTRIFAGEHAMLSVVTIAPNAEGIMHHHPEEQWGVLLEGSAVRFQGAEEIPVKKAISGARLATCRTRCAPGRTARACSTFLPRRGRSTGRRGAGLEPVESRARGYRRAFFGATCYISSMTKLLRDAIKQGEELPDGEQDAAAIAMLDYLAHRRDLRISDEQLAEIRRRSVDPDRKLVSQDEARARIRRLGA